MMAGAHQPGFLNQPACGGGGVCVWYCLQIVLDISIQTIPVGPGSGGWGGGFFFVFFVSETRK